MKFTFEFIPQCGLSWPKIAIGVNEHRSTVFEISSSNTVSCDFDIAHTNTLNIFYYKTENETVVHDGQIVKDQNLKLSRIWIDDVLMESWFVTEGCYFPQYFLGIKDKYPEWPTQLPSQLIWHFPGVFTVNFHSPFWPWYSNQRKKFSGAPHHSGRDSERWENWSGSNNAHSDLVNEIYKLLNV
jgi:hypothetical protein